MAAPNQAVNLSPEQVEQLNRQLSTMRHDINNQLTLIMAAVELIRCRPQSLQTQLGTISEQLPRITSSMREFSTEFTKTLGSTNSQQQTIP